MCGRYVITKPVTKTIDLVKTNIKVEDLNNYNAHPTQKLPVIKSYTNGKALENYQWGIVPKWAKEKSNFRPLINARLETINEKISFKKLIQTSRCIICADGYYEWKREADKKTPFYFLRKDNKIMLMAGIFENNQFCIITKKASKQINEIHDREPVIINISQVNEFLNLKKNAQEFLEQVKEPSLNYYQISKEVNNPLNNEKSLLEII